MRAEVPDFRRHGKNGRITLMCMGVVDAAGVAANLTALMTEASASPSNGS